MARSFACSSELKAAIDNPSDRSSTSIVSFGFRSLVLRKHERYNSGWHLLDGVSSKLRLCGFLRWLVQGWYHSDVTIQATNWLAVGRAPTMIRHAVTALRSFPKVPDCIFSYPYADRKKSVVKCLFNFGSRCTRHNIMTRKQIQWKPSKADTIGTKIFVRYSEVSLAQGWWLTTPLLQSRPAMIKHHCGPK